MNIKELSELTHRVKQVLDRHSAASQSVQIIGSTLKTFIDTYRHHIETENKHFFPHVMENLSQEEFDVIDFDLFDRVDPVYDNRTEGRFARLRDEIVLKGDG